MFYLIQNIQNIILALARWLGWLEHHPVHQKVVGSVASWVTYRRQLTDVSLSHQSLCLSPSLSLKAIKTYPWVNMKNIHIMNIDNFDKLSI